ncbi:poly [Culex quinquefasciatus]|uniref:NAD(+) ADP-ribosyltransferase n=1 Tax=Culex quinquefasciatus TaxID=7176 RepID=B0WX77_CULQU|nr:poly [Culex quinquefasciatus]|eukprot:XP_001861999.1 poly [Culex quinquefasciatus]
MPPPYNLQFVMLGKTETPKDQLKGKILKLGAKVASKITNTIAVIISTPAKVEKMGSRMQVCRTRSCRKFTSRMPRPAVRFRTSRASPSTIGGPICSRIPQEEEKFKLTKSIYITSVPSKVTLILKGSLAVCSDSGLGEVTHVYKRKKLIFNCVLIKVDIQTDKNSYFKVQVLEAYKDNMYLVFLAWGRIGTTIEGNNRDSGGTVVKASKTNSNVVSGWPLIGLRCERLLLALGTICVMFQAVCILGQPRQQMNSEYSGLSLHKIVQLVPCHYGGRLVHVGRRQLRMIQRVNLPYQFCDMELRPAEVVARPRHDCG